MRVEVMKNVLGSNATAAESNRSFWNQHGMLALDLMGSPGSGKTSILEQLVRELTGRGRSMRVIEGDVASDNDARRIEAAGAEAFQINTGGACHLHAAMVARALQQLDLAGVEIILIENVGNLVCPTAFKLGAHFRIVVASVPEGDDKPEKYPVAFRDADVIILNKTDLLPHLAFDADHFWDLAEQLNSSAPQFNISCTTGEGIEALCNFVDSELAKLTHG
jgi:hydrogenase nickel incorporation protein HypB